jgi:hypothetical protein
MANWNALHNYITQNYKVMEDDFKTVKLLFNLDGGRSQLVLVNYGGELEGSEWAVISTAVCEETDISSRDAMVRNSQMLMGGLALVDGGPVIFRYSIRLADLDPGEFEVPLKVVVLYGDDLERELSSLDRY